MAGILKKSIFRIYQTMGRMFLTPMLMFEWKKPLFFKEMNERPIEFGFAFKWLSRTCPKEVLDVGSGTTSWPHIMANCGFHVTAIDKIKEYWEGDFFNRHYYVMDDDITDSKLTDKFDVITCISVIEHIPNHKEAIKGMFKLLKPGGHIILTFPYNENKYIENAYKLPDASVGKDFAFICQVYSRKEIEAWLEEKPGKIIEQKYYEVYSGEYWTEGKRIYPPREVQKGEKCHLSCIIIQKSD